MARCNYCGAYVYGDEDVYGCPLCYDELYSAANNPSRPVQVSSPTVTGSSNNNSSSHLGSITASPASNSLLSGNIDMKQALFYLALFLFLPLFGLFAYYYLWPHEAELHISADNASEGIVTVVSERDFTAEGNLQNGKCKLKVPCGQKLTVSILAPHCKVEDVVVPPIKISEKNAFVSRHLTGEDKQLQVHICRPAMSDKAVKVSVKPEGMGEIAVSGDEDTITLPVPSGVKIKLTAAAANCVTVTKELLVAPEQKAQPVTVAFKRSMGTLKCEVSNKSKESVKYKIVSGNELIDQGVVESNILQKQLKLGRSYEIKFFGDNIVAVSQQFSLSDKKPDAVCKNIVLRRNLGTFKCQVSNKTKHNVNYKIVSGHELVAQGVVQSNLLQKELKIGKSYELKLFGANVNTVSQKFRLTDDKPDAACKLNIMEKPFSIGTYVAFGRYPQNKGNTPEPIKWLVLDNNGSTALLLSKDAIDCRPFHHKSLILDGEDYYSESATWFNCDLRKWLNNDFINRAFNASEKSQIRESVLYTYDNEWFGTKGCGKTHDKIFCLSIEEYEKYFPNKEVGKCSLTEFAGKQFSRSNHNRDYHSFFHNNYCNYWLRSPGEINEYESSLFGTATFVSDGGFVNMKGLIFDINLCFVRPALRIKLK